MEKTSFRHRQIRGWNREYSQKGALWNGPGYIDFELPPNARVLELGCGNGKTLSTLLKTDCIITAIDSSDKAVDMCRALASKEEGGVNVLRADACELPFPESSFDIVIAFHILEHLLFSDRSTAVSEINRVLAPKGRVLVRVFSTGDMRFGKGEEVEENTFVRGRNKLAYHYFTEDELRELFKNFREKDMRTVQRTVEYHHKPRRREQLMAVYEKL
ncbi:MAG: class I SAM-dependent methyltransferase [Candidatus Micrarchaeota archaeon]